MSLFRKIAIILSINFSLLLYSQTDTEKSDFINDIYNEALSNGNSYEWLDYLSNEIGGRLSGSINAERAVNWGKEDYSEGLISCIQHHKNIHLQFCILRVQVNLIRL